MSKQAVVILFLEIALFLLLSDGRKIRKITAKNLFQHENFTEEGSGDDDSTAAFSDWSEWSRCNRNCKQVRTRFCQIPEVCQNKVEKIQKACPSASCKVRITVPLPKYENSSYRPSKAEVLQHMEPYLYTEWSEWTECSESCVTKRTRKCRYKAICGGVQEQSEKCYSEGDDCEKIEHSQRPSDLEEEEESHPLDNIVCGVSKAATDTRIMGGRAANKGSWPWQVLILDKKRTALCGGMLLSKEWILTAAHCVRKRLYVRAGEYDLTEVEDTEQQERVATTFVHPNYNPVTVESDIALLKMRIPFELNPNVQPLCLPQEDDELPYYSRATIAGWGTRRSESIFVEPVLRETNVPIIPPKECRNAYKDVYMSDHMICAGFAGGRVDSCRGDSGGPLMHKQRDGRWAAYGVTSFGEGCGEKGKFGVYANVVSHLSWIRSVIKNYN